MKTRRLLTTLALAGVMGLSGVAAFAQRGQRDPEPQAATPRGAWTPKEEDPEQFDLIVALNIFNADRTRLARDYERSQNPEPVVQRTPTPRTDRDPPPPPDPDTSWVLRGISRLGDKLVVFIENNKTGEVTRLEGPSDFSKGQIGEIGFDTVVYAIDGEQRVITIGQSLTGERVTPATQASGRTASSSSGSGRGSSGSSAGLQDRLAELRARREREQGGGTPRPAPTGDAQPTEVPNGTPPTEATEDAPGFDEDEDFNNNDGNQPVRFEPSTLENE